MNAEERKEEREKYLRSSTYLKYASVGMGIGLCIMSGMTFQKELEFIRANYQALSQNPELHWPAIKILAEGALMNTYLMIEGLENVFKQERPFDLLFSGLERLTGNRMKLPKASRYLEQAKQLL